MLIYITKATKKVVDIRFDSFGRGSSEILGRGAVGSDDQLCGFSPIVSYLTRLGNLMTGGLSVLLT